MKIINKFKNADDIFAGIVESLKQKSGAKIDQIKKAYDWARSLHADQKRKTGEPYILHPVCVCKILEEQNFSADILCAALLHDIVEDCGVKLSEIYERFGDNVGQIVDAVTAIDKEDFDECDDDIFADQEFLKYSVDSKTYKKLIAIGKKNKYAFYIKFADRLHNLQTIQPFSKYKKLEKVKDTERWILPLAKMMKSHYFFHKIQNECFKILHSESIVSFDDEFFRYLKSNKNSFNEVGEIITIQTKNYLSKNSIKAELFKIEIEPVSELRVFQHIKDRIEIRKVADVKQSHFNKVPTNNIYMIFSTNISNKKASEIMMSVLDIAKVSEKVKIVGFILDDKMNVGKLVIEDELKNKYKICAMSLANFTIFKNGTLDGTDIDYIDDVNSNEVSSNYFDVKTRSGEVIRMEEGSTVLDFAFRLHNELGFSCKYARLNGYLAKVPLYTKLTNGDKIELFCEKNEQTGELENVAKIRWLAYVKTDYAKKSLIRYFEKTEKNI